MAVNKNFVVKNGIEIAVNLIYGDTDLQKVGIGSTTPRSLLDVHGDFRAEKGAYITGIATAVEELNVGIGGTALTVLNSNGFSGFNITDPVYNVDVRRRVGAGDTAAYFQGQVNVDGTLVPNNLRVAGLSTLSNVNIDDGEVEIAKLEVTGLSTFTGIGTFVSDLYVGGTLNVADDLFISGISTFVGVSTFQSDVFVDGNLNVTGDLVYDEVSGRNINISGVSTFGTVQISNGQITSTSGVVTYFGDGSNLTGIATELTATIGIGSEGTFIGSGVTQLNFNSTNGAAIAVDAATIGIATVTFTPGVSLGLAIALGS
tara:strand:- start:1661 stop:2608 length:948 start_codon:yes stop_codon:yes gene_type:complete